MVRFVLVFFVLLSLFLLSSAQTCDKYTFSSKTIFNACNDLPYQKSFLYWNYNSSSGSLQIAFRNSMSTSKWVAWAINPNGLKNAMIGAQALVAYQLTNGTMRAYTSQINSYATTLPEGKLIYDVSGLTATYANNEIIIFATLALPKNSTIINQVWQEGPVTNDVPVAHSFDTDHTNSIGTLNVLSGQTGSSGGINYRTRNRDIHGVLNAVSWGFLMPIGVMIARYVKVLKSADPAWFYLHATCQTSAYIIGVAGWATGIKLGNDSSGVEYSGHKTLGILLFILATLQVFALLLRPKKDHKYRLYWNIYHHSVGYLVILLSIINIFKGFDILKPEKKYKHAYIGIIVALAVNALWMEGCTWYVVLKRRRTESPAETSQGLNGANWS